MSGTEIAYGATSFDRPNLFYTGQKSAIYLRACDAMPGTDIAYGAIGVRTCYSMSGTDVASGTTSHGPVDIRRRQAGSIPPIVLHDVRC
eukprot:2511256-Rhodomonas_salina.2